MKQCVSKMHVYVKLTQPKSQHDWTSTTVDAQLCKNMSIVSVPKCKKLTNKKVAPNRFPLSNQKRWFKMHRVTVSAWQPIKCLGGIFHPVPPCSRYNLMLCVKCTLSKAESQSERQGTAGSAGSMTNMGDRNGKFKSKWKTQTCLQNLPSYPDYELWSLGGASYSTLYLQQDLEGKSKLLLKRYCWMFFFHGLLWN